jgi:hypothetical protein
MQLFLGLTLASTLAGCPNTGGGEGVTTDRRSPNPVASPADNEGGEGDEDNDPAQITKAVKGMKITSANHRHHRAEMTKTMKAAKAVKVSCKY